MPTVEAPDNRIDCLKIALFHMLEAANALLGAADFAEEGDDVSVFVNAALRLREWTEHLIPNTSSWPSGPGVADIIDIHSRKRLNG